MTGYAFPVHAVSHTTRFLARIVLYTEVDVQCHKLATVVARASTVANTVNQDRLNQWAQWARAHGPGFFSFSGAPNWLW